jgi:hypothetical protein
MSTLQFLVSAFPIAFMIHDFEEIIFIERWISNNKDYLARRFPSLSQVILPRIENLSTAGFALAVAEEFLLASAITYVSLYLNSYYLWLCIFLGFSIHLMFHIVQSIIVRRYIPSLVTSVMLLPYCVYTLIVFVQSSFLTIRQMIFMTMMGLLIIVLNVLFAHRLASWIIKPGKKV